MTLGDELYTAVDRYREETARVVHGIDDLRGSVEALSTRLAGTGPLGASSDPDLVRARARLALALARLGAATEAAQASREPCARYLGRAFPR